ncbi:hypothetical protein O9X98_14585 [Agrobacterium salinitolerans]|nr:hypothetical protein [Agrobacterium salinitolerans]
MARPIRSAELWDRLALILGEEADQLPPRPSGPQPHKFTFGGTFETDRVGNTARNHEAVGRVIGSLKSCARRIGRGEYSERTVVSENCVATVFYAMYEHADEDGRADRMTVHFTAADEYDAISSALRFWMARQVAMPDFFNQLFALKVSQETFGPIDADGGLFNGKGFPFFEWKIDSRGVALELYALEWIAERIEAEVRRDALTSS